MAQFAKYIAKKISIKSEGNFSGLIIKIGIGGISLSLTIMLLSVFITKGFYSEIENKLTGFAAPIQIRTFDLNESFEAQPLYLDPIMANKIKSLAGVKNIQPFIQKAGIIKSGENIQGIVMKGIDSTYQTEYLSKILVKGYIPDYKNIDEQNSVLISEYLANSLFLDTGKKLNVYFVQQPVRARSFNIKGIFKSGLDMHDRSFAICNIHMIRTLYSWPDSLVQGYEVLLNNNQNMTKLKPKINTYLGIDKEAITSKELYPQIYDWLALLDQNVWIILILMSIVGIINMITALLILILERTNMIGILKALGAKNHQVRNIFLRKANQLTLNGILIGNLVAMGIFIIQYYTHIIPLDNASYYVDHVPVKFDWIWFTGVNLGCYLICLMSLLIPTVLISNISPVKAIRFN